MAITYPLEKLKSIRSKRFDDASKKVTECKSLLTQALNNLEKSKKDLEDYKVYIKEETNRRYSKLIGTINSQEKIHKFNEGIASLSMNILSYEEAVVKCEQEVKQAKEDLEVAKSEFLVANKALKKIEMHKEIYMAGVAKEIEIAEEKELEDFHVRENEY